MLSENLEIICAALAVTVLILQLYDFYICRACRKAGDSYIKKHSKIMEMYDSLKNPKEIIAECKKVITDETLAELSNTIDEQVKEIAERRIAKQLASLDKAKDLRNEALDQLYPIMVTVRIEAKEFMALQAKIQGDLSKMEHDPKIRHMIRAIASMQFIVCQQKMIYRDKKQPVSYLEPLNFTHFDTYLKPVGSDRTDIMLTGVTIKGFRFDPANGVWVEYDATLTQENNVGGRTIEELPAIIKSSYPEYNASMIMPPPDTTE